MLCWFGLFSLLLASAGATPGYQTRVKVIHAAGGPAHIDPGIRELVREIEPVFTYTNYRLLKEKKMTLAEKKKGRMDLPGNRTLFITPTQMNGNRIKYQIRIDAKGKSVFQTGILLKNRHSITIGGPKYKKGILLLNIHGTSP